MYTTTRNIAGDTFMTCKDCGHTVSMNKMCEKPLQSASDILKHISACKSSQVIAVPGHVLEQPALTSPAICRIDNLWRVRI